MSKDFDEEVQASPGDSGDKRGNAGTRWFAIGCLVLVVYVLGIGPAEKLHRSGILPTPLYVTVYRPLMTLGMYCRPFDRFLSWYVEDVWKCPMF